MLADKKINKKGELRQHQYQKLPFLEAVNKKKNGEAESKKSDVEMKLN